MGLKVREFVTIVMPSLNEERAIAASIMSVLPQQDCGFELELIVVDGGSDDATRGIVSFLAKADPRIRLIHNPARTQAAGVNLAARVADPRSTVLVRADCHARYPSDFVTICVESLRSAGAASVVVPMRTVGSTCIENAISAAQNSTLGNGGAAHRQSTGLSERVAHGHHAAFDRRIFLELGGYDEGFVANEDAEYDMRLVDSGRVIWMARGAMIDYSPRSDLVSLGRQYFRNGIGRVSTSAKSGNRLGLRQLLPIFALTACLASCCIGFVDQHFLAVPATYALLVSLWATHLAVRDRKPCVLMAGAAAVTMHMAFALGAVVALSQAGYGRTGRVKSLGPSGNAA